MGSPNRFEESDFVRR